MDNNSGDWSRVNLSEVVGSAIAAAGVGMIRLLVLIRTRRRVRWVDVLLEPAIAVFAGMCAWALAEVANTPDVLQAVLTSVGAWSGPRLIHRLEVRYFGGSRHSDSYDEDNTTRPDAPTWPDVDRRG